MFAYVGTHQIEPLKYVKFFSYQLKLKEAISILIKIQWPLDKGNPMRETYSFQVDNPSLEISPYIKKIENIIEINLLNLGIW